MAEPQNKEQFKEYILRRLGSPVIPVAVDEEQIYDRIDDALSYFRDYHYLGSEKIYYLHNLTEEDVIKKSILLSERIIEVVGIVKSSVVSGSGLMDAQHQLIKSELLNLSIDGSVIPYVTKMMRIQDMQQLFSVDPEINFNRHKNELKIYWDWRSCGVGSPVMIECWAYYDEISYKDIWSDRWLKEYATQLVKRQHGENLKLTSGIQLMGGVTLNGESIYSEAEEKISKLEEEMMNKYSPPVMDAIG